MKLLIKRFIWRDFVREDAPDFEVYHADPCPFRFYDDEDTTPGHAQDLIELFMAWTSESPRLHSQLAIGRCHDTRPRIGCCSLRRAGSECGKVERGIELAPAYWSRYGHAIEVMEAFVDVGCGEVGLQEISDGTVSAHSRITRVAESCGAVAVTRPAPAWMVARAWRAVEWHLTRTPWEGGRLTIRSSRRAKARC